MEAVLYVHGMGGSASESAHYAPLFPDCEVVGLDYKAFTPWETGAEIRAAVGSLLETHESVTLIANSIGAFFSMYAGVDALIREAYFISPVVDMEELILGMAERAGITEAQLETEGVIRTDEGELSWEYLRFVRAHPLRWEVPTRILCGENDALTPTETMRAFADAHGARLTVMPGGEHWFHTDAQMRFLDEWIDESREKRM